MRRLAFLVLVFALAGCGDKEVVVPAAGAPSPAVSLRVADLNILHGIFCRAATHNCRLSDRIDLLFQWIGRAGCPDVVTLQEMWPRAVPLVMAHLGTVCPFAYAAVYEATTIQTDDQMILSRYPVLRSQVEFLFGGFRTLSAVRIDHPLGPVDVFSTHLASSSDQAQEPCVAPDCPPACVGAGAVNKRDCQAVQLAEFVEQWHHVPTPAVISGDFNESPGSFVYEQFTRRGWFDAHLAAGNAECNPSSGANCTSGRLDEELTDLEAPQLRQTERIDFIFVVPAAHSGACSVDAGDGDGDGTSTGMFAGDPNPFAEACRAAPLPICWPSDHSGVQLDLNCRR